MSESSTQPRSIVDLVIPHATAPQVLLIDGAEGWQLPRFTFAESVYGDLAVVNRAVRERCGLSATILRMLAGEYDEAIRQSHLTYLLEWQQPHWTPPGEGRWVGR